MILEKVTAEVRGKVLAGSTTSANHRPLARGRQAPWVGESEDHEAV